MDDQTRHLSQLLKLLDQVFVALQGRFVLIAAFPFGANWTFHVYSNCVSSRRLETRQVLLSTVCPELLEFDLWLSRVRLHNDRLPDLRAASNPRPGRRWESLKQRIAAAVPALAHKWPGTRVVMASSATVKLTRLQALYGTPAAVDAFKAGWQHSLGRRPGRCSARCSATHFILAER